MDRETWIRRSVEEHSGALLRYAVHVTGNLELARDVVQDTFLKLCAADRARVEPHLAEWLFTVCRNRALDLLRKDHRMQPMSDSHATILPTRGASPRTEALRKDDTSTLIHLLNRLPKRQQEVVRLKFQNGLSYDAISRVTALSVSNVGFLLHTALKTLRQQFAQQP